MKRFGPALTDRRLHRLQTRREVERAALDDQDQGLELVSFGSIGLGLYNQRDGRALKVFTVRCMHRMPDAELAKVLSHGGWISQNGRMHLGYLQDKATQEPVRLPDAVRHTAKENAS